MDYPAENAAATLALPAPVISPAGPNIVAGSCPPDSCAPRVRKRPSVREFVGVDVSQLDFGTFFPGKIFKCTLCVRNLSSQSRAIKLHYDLETKEFSAKSVLDEFFSEAADRPAFGANESLANSEPVHHCWYLMLGRTKSFEKQTTISLEPGEDMDIGVVVKSPHVIGKKLYAELRMGLDPDVEVLRPEGELSVFLSAEVETPRLECCRELIYSSNNTRVIPIVVRFEEPVQKLKVPFRNNSSQEVEVQLSIVPFPNISPMSGGCSGGKRRMFTTNVMCVPSTCKLPAKTDSLINLNATYNLDYDEEQGERYSGRKREQRIMIAKIKGTQMIYYYVLDLNFIVEQ